MIPQEIENLQREVAVLRSRQDTTKELLRSFREQKRRMKERISDLGARMGSLEAMLRNLALPNDPLLPLLEQSWHTRL